MTTPTITTRFLIISNTHDFKYDDPPGPFRTLPAKIDVLLHCGDLTQIGGASEYKRALKMLASIPAELKLVIAGNHDLSLDPNYWKTVDEDKQEAEKEDHEEALEIMTGKLAKDAGVTYLTEGTHTFVFKSGAKFILCASPYQPKFGDWTFNYEKNEDRFNSTENAAAGTISVAQNPVPDFSGVDIMMTHGPPKGILDETVHGHLGCDSLLHALKRCRPRLHCFGHIHEGYGANFVTWKKDNDDEAGSSIQKQELKANCYLEPTNVGSKFGKETLLVNAAIMDGTNKPTNDPWAIDLDLRRE
jgi:predicted phosphodiesterase